MTAQRSRTAIRHDPAGPTPAEAARIAASRMDLVRPLLWLARKPFWVIPVVLVTLAFCRDPAGLARIFGA